jgi:predicted heme/steroid binding protein
MAGLSGCSGSVHGTGTTPPPASITSFVASQATITAGQSATLTGVFANGTGVITPGNLAATSGVAVSVSPTATTTYTLTVTPTSGTAVTATAAITVTPAVVALTVNSANPDSGVTIDYNNPLNNVIIPGVTSFTVNEPAGTTLNLTAPPTAGGNSFASWTGCTSSSTVNCSVTLNANMTVTANYSVPTTVTVDPSTPGIPVTDQLLGMNLAAWYDWPDNASSITSAFNAAGIKAIRWPGGSWSDDYHWGFQPGGSTLIPSYMCQTASPVAGGWGGYSTFADFVSSIPLAGPYDLALTANYGTNEACTGGGDPSEAASWAAAAVSAGITVSHMTVGNEEYGNWETDLHANPHDPATYAEAVTGSSGYYELIKAASPKSLVGVVVDADNTDGGWDNTVLANAKGSYDFVEFHYYPEAPGQEDDTALVQQLAPNLTTNLNILKAELAKWGTPNTPIYVGEMGSVYTNPGKQSWSITQGLFAGQVLGEMMNDGVSRATWWIGFGNCNGSAGNDSSALYGWQDFGAYNVFADGAGDTGGTDNSPCNYGGPIGTMSPTARAYQLFSNIAINGESVLTPTVTGDTTDVRAYAATNNGGTALFLFNTNETTSQPVTVTVTGESTSPGVTVITYDKAVYDQSQTDVWAAPTATNLGQQTLPLTLTLTPWSMNVVLIK